MTVVVPIGNKSPGVWFLVKLNRQLSVAVGSIQFIILPQPPSVFTIVSDGQSLITGNSSSVTITLKEQVAVFPEGSVAV